MLLRANASSSRKQSEHSRRVRHESELRSNHTSFLTIGVPTRNRVQAITGHVRALIDNRVHERAQVLVIDNASTDGTFEQLAHICQGTGIRVLQNPANVGFNGNFVRLVSECQTEYLLVTSDEDPVIEAHLEELVGFLKQKSPIMVSPQTYSPMSADVGRLTGFRGTRSHRPIRPQEFRRCSSRFPGLVFRTHESKRALDNMEGYIQRDALHAYPQLLLAAELLINGEGWWWARTIVRQKYFHPSLQGSYNHVPQRWEQHKALADFLADRRDNAPDADARNRAATMLESHRDSLFLLLRNAIRRERADFLGAFDRGAMRFFFRSTSALTAHRCRMIATHPFYSCRKAIRRCWTLVGRPR